MPLLLGTAPLTPPCPLPLLLGTAPLTPSPCGPKAGPPMGPDEGEPNSAIQRSCVPAFQAHPTRPPPHTARSMPTPHTDPSRIWVKSVSPGHSSWRQYVANRWVPLSHARDPLSHARNPFSHAQDPLSHARDPLNHARDPLSHARDPLSHARDPLMAVRSQEGSLGPLGV